MRTHQSTDSLALLTDLYQLTMAYGYWKRGKAEQHATFHLFFRNSPFGGGLAIAAGLEPALDYLRSFRFTSDDVDFLGKLVGNDGQRLFESAFLDFLAQLKLTLDIDAFPEGTVVFPHEPLLRVSGSILQCQLLETALLNILNFQSLIATKAARIVLAANGDPVLEFGLRRAQGIDGALAASRAAFIGGCAATSNVLAGKLYGIPVKGTHAHSWVISFDSEPQAFDAYAAAMPNNCVFLVDTYDTLQGVRNAIDAGRKLGENGHRMVGIRLDSGDLASLSIEARKLLDEAGFADATIVASNDLDERLIQSLKLQGAAIGVWGVGTKLVTAYDQPALGGVYKLGAIQDDNGQWQPKIKVSEQLIKTSTPGIQQVRRYYDASGLAIGDVIYNELQAQREPWIAVDLQDSTKRREFFQCGKSEDLLLPVLRAGQVVANSPSLSELRARTLEQLQKFQVGILRFDNPDEYPVGLELQLHELKARLVLDARRATKSEDIR